MQYLLSVILLITLQTPKSIIREKTHFEVMAKDLNCIMYSGTISSAGTTSDVGSEVVDCTLKVPVVQFQKTVIRKMTANVIIIDATLKQYDITEQVSWYMYYTCNPNGTLVQGTGTLVNQKIFTGGNLNRSDSYEGIELSGFATGQAPAISFVAPRGSWPVNPSAGSVTMQVNFTLILELLEE